MTLAADTRLGVYQVTALIGQGGMGEVYRATDTNLGRQVAIKVLPAAVAQDAERVARFEREAKTLAALNHPNIAQIYGLERGDGVTGLVMELVEGDDLAQRIARGPIPLDEALQIAKQIAEALEAAHELGIIHRDLKPANVKVRPDGTAKVLDFGLAKALEPAGAPSDLSQSPTITSPAMTARGVILGTAAYMSPEQARGRQVDKRSDIWAFGCVLYEMLTSRRAFEDEDVSMTLSKVLRGEPDFSLLPAGLAPSLVTFLKRLLQKEPRQRVRDIGDVRLALEGVFETNASGPVAVAVRPAASRWSVAGWAVAALALIALATFSWRGARMASQELLSARLSVPLPEGAIPGFLALSPDGRQLVTDVGPDVQLWVRSLDSAEGRILTGTQRARAPFWSPDSRTIAFFADGALKTVPTAGGPPQTLCTETGLGGGGSWNRADIILFATEVGALRRVGVADGVCTDLINAEPGFQAARFPVFLPDGRHFLYSRGINSNRRELFVASLDEPNGWRLLGDNSSAEFVPDQSGLNTGHLLFVREETLMAQMFDVTSLQVSGEPFAVAARVGQTASSPQIAASASMNGTVAFVVDGQPPRELVWRDRSGKRLGSALSAFRELFGVALAPHGRAVVFRYTNAENRGETRLIDVERSQDTRLFAPPLSPSYVVWSPDGARILFSGDVAGNVGLYARNVSGGPEELLLKQAESPRRPSDWSRDGRWIVYTENDRNTRGDIWLLPTPPNASAGKAVPLLRTAANESEGQISPDGRWLAYTSDEAGFEQVYLRPFTGSEPVPDVKWSITAAGRAVEPRWRADGRELYWLERNATRRTTYALVAVPINEAPNPVGAPIRLFELQTTSPVIQNNSFTYSPSADGQRFLISGFAADARPSLDVILNWPASLKN